MDNFDKKWSRNFELSQKRLLLKERAVAHMGGSCLICGYARCPSALVFHHVDPKEKDFTISSRMRWAAIEKELTRCILLCANCHSEVHAGWHPLYLASNLEDRSLYESD